MSFRHESWNFTLSFFIPDRPDFSLCILRMLQCFNDYFIQEMMTLHSILSLIDVNYCNSFRKYRKAVTFSGFYTLRDKFNPLIEPIAKGRKDGFFAFPKTSEWKGT